MMILVGPGPRGNDPVTIMEVLLTMQHESPSLLTDAKLLNAFLAKMNSELVAIRKYLSTEQFDIDEWDAENAQTVFQCRRDYDGPIVITSLIAAFPTTSTAVSIQTGVPGRNIPITNLSTGLVVFDDLRIQCGKDDFPRGMTIAPAGAGYINFFGYADKSVIDVTS